MSQRVWVLQEGEMYEGGQLLGLYTSRDKAEAEALKAQENAPPMELRKRTEDRSLWSSGVMWMEITWREVV